MVPVQQNMEADVFLRSPVSSRPEVDPNSESLGLNLRETVAVPP